MHKPHISTKVKVKVAQLCPTLCDPMHCIEKGVLQARILEDIAFSFSSRSSRPRNWTRVSYITGGLFTRWAPREAPYIHEVVSSAVHRNKSPRPQSTEEKERECGEKKSHPASFLLASLCVYPYSWIQQGKIISGGRASWLLWRSAAAVTCIVSILVFVGDKIFMRQS